MVREQVYLDTTVASAMFDDRAPDRQELTRQFWTERLPDFEPVLSGVVVIEIEGTPDEVRRQEMRALVAGMRILPNDEDSEGLADEYVRRAVFPRRYRTDALHVAIATVCGVRNLVSWNFRHLVRLRTRREVDLVNALKGYMPIEILAPPEL